ncbi:MAG: ribonuclease III [Lachnospiraceae bacterium]|nr:ribonuclease III [Lachnospiraceae bacterium]
MNILDIVNEKFELDNKKPEEITPLMLAYIGDAVYEVVSRTIVMSGGNRPINQVHRDNTKIVNATTQARMAEVLMDVFDEAEASQYRRGKNAKSQTSAKNSSLADYRKATGLEAVIGYLYLKGNNDRLIELINTGFEKLGL